MLYASIRHNNNNKNKKKIFLVFGFNLDLYIIFVTDVKNKSIEVFNFLEG